MQEHRGRSDSANRSLLDRHHAVESGFVNRIIAFVNREPLLMNPGDLIAAIKDIAAFVGPPLKAASDGVAFDKSWKARGGWRKRRTKTT